MVDGILLGEDLLKAKVRGERAGADVAGMRYVGYELGLTERSLHVYGRHCDADIADEDYRYMVLPLESVRSVAMTDLTDRGRSITIQGADDEVVLYSENQSTLGENLKRFFLLLSRVLA
jgi:hypothetical protein